MVAASGVGLALGSYLAAPALGRVGLRRHYVASIALMGLGSAGAALSPRPGPPAPGRRRRATAQAAVPAVAGIVLAVAMDRNRLFTSVQLLPELLGDPFGRGWDLLGTAGSGLDPTPLGVRGLLAAQLAVLLAGHVAGAVVIARRTAPRARLPAAVGLAILANVSVVALASH